MNDIIKKRQLIYNIISILCILIAAIARYFNIGWITLIIMYLGPIHAILFIIANNILAKKNSNKHTKILFILSCITFLSSYLLFPDFGDYGGPYSFFSLIRNEQLLDTVSILAKFSFLINIALIFITFKNNK